MRTHHAAYVVLVVLVLCSGCSNPSAALDSQLSQSLRYEFAAPRGTQAVIGDLPAVSIKGALKSIQRDLGAGYNDIVYFSKPRVPRHGFLTANNNVPYGVAIGNTTGGPVVLDVPAACEKTMYFSSIVDIWQTPIAGIGPHGDDKSIHRTRMGGQSPLPSNAHTGD